MIDLGGTFRTVSAEETLARVIPLLSTFGITRVADVTGLDSIGIPVYQSIRPYSKSLSVSQGKGLNKALAKVSAIMESIELWHAENIRKPDLYGSYSELSNSYDLVEPSELTEGPCYSRNLEESPLFWIRTTDLYTHRDVYVPYTLLHLDFSDFLNRPEFHLRSSNGLASGNILEEALCHGLYEVIERDARARTNYKNAMKVDLNTIKCPYLQFLIDKIKKADLSLILFDITSTLQIPSYAALLFGDAELRSLQAFSGFGTHLSKEVAASRAITEAVQSRLTTISGARDDIPENRYQVGKKRKSKYSVSVDKNSFLAGNSLNDLSNVPNLKAFTPITTIPKTFQDCLQRLLEQLRRNGYERILFYNHTREELGIPVAHVVVPRLRFFHLKL